MKRFQVLLGIFLISLTKSAFCDVISEQKTIISFSPDGEIIFNDTEVRKILSNPQIADRKVVVYSITGNQKGKSFMMNYALRFMYANVSKIINKSVKIDLKK